MRRLRCVPRGPGRLMPSKWFAALMAGRSTEETKRMLFEGVEMVARQGGGAVVEESGAGEMEETWKRVRVTPGVEIHLRDDLPKLKPAELRRLLERLLERLEVVLRRNI